MIQTKNPKIQNISKEKDNDIEESVQGTKMESNNKSVMVQDTNTNPYKPEDNRHSRIYTR